MPACPAERPQQVRFVCMADVWSTVGPLGRLANIDTVRPLVYAQARSAERWQGAAIMIRRWFTPGWYRWAWPRRPGRLGVRVTLAPPSCPALPAGRGLVPRR
jgi:hypothetical protein